MSMTRSLRIRSRVQLLVAFSLAAAFVPSRIHAQADIAGDWEIQMDQNGRKTFASLSISKKADGTFTGKWGRTEISDVKFDGNKLTFVRTIRFGDQEFTTNYEGTLKDGSIAGSLSSERGSFPANAARRKPRSPALGRWDFKYMVGDREILSTLVVTEGPGGLEGKWTSNSGEHVVSNVKLQEGKLSFARKSKFADRELETTYEAVLQGNKLSGTIKSELGEIPANGQRVGAELAGMWELTSTSDRGPRTSLLTIYEDLTGRYEMFGGETPFKDLKLDGNKVSFTVETGFGDQSFTIDFKGQVDGKTLKGEVTTPRGTREVTGKKVDQTSPLVGTWEITRESTQGPRTVKLTIKEDLTGTYAIEDNIANITDLRLEGDEVSFKVTVKRGEREVPTEFKGKLDGTTLKGQLITERGAREATGKKVNTNLKL